jgi:hypothetical protein
LLSIARSKSARRLFPWNTPSAAMAEGEHGARLMGPLAESCDWARTLSGSRGLWGEALLNEMQRYNHSVGLKVVSEYLPQERNRVTLTDEKDQYGLPIPRVTYSWCDNDFGKRR